MPEAREEILSRIGSALGERSAHALSVSVSPPPEEKRPFDRDELIRALRTELLRVCANVFLARDAASVFAVIAEIARNHSAKTLIGWGSAALSELGLDTSLRQSSLDVLLDDDAVSAEDFRSFAASADIGLTGVDYAIADTGSLFVLSGRGRARSASLLPPVHIAIVTRDRIVAGLQDVFASLAAGKHAGMNSAITFITGPSRTADIELTLVVGVHGPQVLNVVILEQQ